MTREEVREVLGRLEGTPKLVVALLYGAGLRLLEALRLRVKDLDFPARILTVRDGKGAKDRRTMLPPILIEPLRDHLAVVRRLHDGDLACGRGEVLLPCALARKYPQAGIEWSWQYVFPAPRLSTDPRGGVIRRHHLDESCIQKLSGRRCARRTSPSRPDVTPSGTRSPRTCWGRGTTCGPSR